MRKKRSPIWNMAKVDLATLVQNSSSFSTILRHFGLNNIGGNINTLKTRLDSEDINYSHIKSGRGSNAGRMFNSCAVPLEQVMVENSNYSRCFLKKRIIKDGIIEYVCDICQSGPSWNDKRLVLVLDHINGVRNDNRKENLRFLCPNCNSQSDTFAGRRKQYGKKTIFV